MDALHEIHAWEGVLVYTIYLPDFQGIVCKPLCREINARLCKYIFTAAQLNNFTFYTASLHNKKTRTKALDLMKKTSWTEVETRNCVAGSGVQCTRGIARAPSSC